MNQIFYLEPDEEITKVIDRIRKCEESGVVLVVPRGATLSQSVINLKLLKRSAKAHSKSIGIVSLDKVTGNLASQQRIKVFSKVSEAEAADLKEEKIAEPDQPSVKTDESSLKVHTYRKYDLSELNKEHKESIETKADQEEAEAEEIIEPEIIDDDVEEEQETEAQDIEDEITPAPEEDDEEEPEERPVAREAKRTEVKNEDKKEDVYMHRRNSGERRHIKTEGSRKFFLIAAGSIALLILVLSFIFIPYAEVSLVLATKDFDTAQDVVVDKSTKEAKNESSTIPGTFVDLEKEVTKDFTSTGKKDQGTKAKGTITISNTTLKNVPVSPNSKVTSADGKVFYIQSGVMVPAGQPSLSNCTSTSDGKVECDVAAGTVDAIVNASANGDEYNLASGAKFTVGSLKAENKSTFTGGVTKNVSYVTDDDLAKAEKTVKEEALNQGKTEFMEKSNSSGLKVNENNISTEIISINSSKNANDEADTFQVKAKVKLLSLGFMESDLRALMVDLVNKSIKADEMLLNVEDNAIAYSITNYDSDGGLIKLKASFKGKVGTKIESQILKDKLVNQSVSDSTTYLHTISGVESVSFKYWPEFLNRTPILKSRINVKFDYQK